MKKKLIVFFALLSITLLILSGCSSEQTIEPIEIDNPGEEFLVTPPDTTSNIEVTCTVQSQELTDWAQPEDHITGELDDGTPFRGRDKIRVIDKGNKQAKNAAKKAKKKGKK